VSVSISTTVLCLIALVAGCGPAKRPETVETVVLPRYTPEQSAIFDDQFDAAALGGAKWNADQKLAERVRLADAIVVARIKTVSEQLTEAGQPNIIVELLPSGNPLKGEASREPVRLTLAPSSPAYRLFRWRQPELLGKDVVLLYRRYTRSDENEVHFRAEPNISEVHAAVRQALTQP
jgi:hypothetical protein